MGNDDDLETYWSAIQDRSPLVSVRNGDLAGGLEAAAIKTEFDVGRKYSHDSPEFRTRAIRIASDAIALFVTAWREDLLARGPGGMIELILADQNLAVPELKSFIRALPESLVRRIVVAGNSCRAASGIHALMAVEYHWRINPGRFSRDYELTRQVDGGLAVTFYRAGGAEPLSFRLDDSFDLDSMTG